MKIIIPTKGQADVIPRKNGVGEGTRTPDPRDHNPML